MTAASYAACLAAGIIVQSSDLMDHVGKSHRISALDFTKGALILFMLLYHWLNYFTEATSHVYKYLRFINPSFIFITGFLISNVYPSKYEFGDPKLPKRLASRGMKLLALFIILNAIISFTFSESYNGRILFDLSSIMNIVSVFITGDIYMAGIGKLAAFEILVPISYLLILSAGILMTGRFYKHVFYLVFLLFLICTYVLHVNDVEYMNIDLLTIGLLGVIIGFLSIDKINGIVSHPYALVSAYLCYLGTITIWDVSYPLQLIGLCLSLVLIYFLGSKNGDPGRMRNQIMLIGKYSLLAYISQIAILQVMHRGIQYINLGTYTLMISLLGAVALTVLTVEAVDHARSKSIVFDRLYKIVFT